MTKNLQIIFKLILAAILGGIIGTEREVNKRPAGLRTHILVTLGSTLIMLVSLESTGDPYRLASQVISGIGFLGAGTIIQRKGEVDGLTTAASLWVSSGIGLAIGIGWYLPAILVVGIVLLTLMGMGIYEKAIFRSNHKIIYIETYGICDKIVEIREKLAQEKIRVRGIIRTENEICYETSECTDKNILSRVQVHGIFPKDCDIIEFMESMLEIEGVHSVMIEGIGRKVNDYT